MEINDLYYKSVLRQLLNHVIPMVSAQVQDWLPKRASSAIQLGVSLVFSQLLLQQVFFTFCSKKSEEPMEPFLQIAKILHSVVKDELRVSGMTLSPQLCHASKRWQVVIKIRRMAVWEFLELLTMGGLSDSSSLQKVPNIVSWLESQVDPLFVHLQKWGPEPLVVNDEFDF